MLDNLCLLLDATVDRESEICRDVLSGLALFTDSLKSYEGLDEFQHEVVDHALEYVRGEVHTNGMENFWSLMKRGLKGTCVSVEPFPLFRYLDERGFRCKNRNMSVADRPDIAARQIVGKRVRYDRLTGKHQDSSSAPLKRKRAETRRTRP